MIRKNITVNGEVFKQFDEIAKRKGIKLSSWVNSKMEEFIKKEDFQIGVSVAEREFPAYLDGFPVVNYGVAGQDGEYKFIRYVDGTGWRIKFDFKNGKPLGDWENF